MASAELWVPLLPLSTKMSRFRDQTGEPNRLTYVKIWRTESTPRNRVASLWCDALEPEWASKANDEWIGADENPGPPGRLEGRRCGSLLCYPGISFASDQNLYERFDTLEADRAQKLRPDTYRPALSSCLGLLYASTKPPILLVYTINLINSCATIN